MENTPASQQTEAKLKTQKSKSHSKAGDLRATIKTLETRLAKLTECSQTETLEILTLFDQADQDLLDLQEKGMAATSELSQLETVTRQFRKKLAVFIHKAGGAQSLEAARQERQPSQDRWWWYADEILGEARKQKATRWFRNLGIIASLLIIGVVVYQKYLAPDPAVQASYGHQQRAENALVSGDYEAALLEIETALTLTPDESNLYTLKGMILDALGETAKAAENYTLAKEKLEQESEFYTQRAILYLMMSRPDLALADSETALAINPDSAISYLNQGQAYEMLGDIQAAIDSYESADETAQRIGNLQLQAIARVSMSNAMQRVILPTNEVPETTKGE